LAELSRYVGRSDQLRFPNVFVNSGSTDPIRR